MDVPEASQRRRKMIKKSTLLLKNKKRLSIQKSVPKKRL
nr:MAG TPA: hypothetical protein [Caudoviricetes sp.]